MYKIGPELNEKVADLLYIDDHDWQVVTADGKGSMSGANPPWTKEQAEDTASRLGDGWQVAHDYGVDFSRTWGGFKVIYDRMITDNFQIVIRDHKERGPEIQLIKTYGIRDLIVSFGSGSTLSEALCRAVVDWHERAENTLRRD